MVSIVPSSCRNWVEVIDSMLNRILAKLRPITIRNHCNLSKTILYRLLSWFYSDFILLILLFIFYFNEITLLYIWLAFIYLSMVSANIWYKRIYRRMSVISSPFLIQYQLLLTWHNLIINDYIVVVVVLLANFIQFYSTLCNFIVLYFNLICFILLYYYFFYIL